MNISVFITSYNQKKYLQEAIESVLVQTLKPYEIIIVDDASSDGSQELIRSYQNQFPSIIKPIFHETNMGVAKVRRDAMKAIQGDYVTYVDGDDLFLPEKLESEAKLIKNNPSFDIVFSNHRNISTEHNESLSEWINNQHPPEGNVFKEVFMRKFPKRSLYKMEMVNYDAWRKIGFHDINLKIFEDYEMRIRMTQKLKVKYNPHCLAEIRLHKKGLSQSTSLNYIEALEYIFKKNFKLTSGLGIEERRAIKKEFFKIINKQCYNEIKRKIKYGNIAGAIYFGLKHLRLDL